MIQGGSDSEAILGTDALGRPFTDAEKKRFEAILRKHDFAGQRIIALRFAMKLARTRERAKDLMGRAQLRLVRSGWNPARVPLVRCLCRLVWSEWTNELNETATTRKAVEQFLQEIANEGRDAIRSAEDRAAEIEAEMKARAHARTRLDELRAVFEKAGDEVNLEYLRHSLADVEDVAEMARLSGRDVKEFYNAQKRRERVVAKLIEERAGLTLKGKR